MSAAQTRIFISRCLLVSFILGTCPHDCYLPCDWLTVSYRNSLSLLGFSCSYDFWFFSFCQLEHLLTPILPFTIVIFEVRAKHQMICLLVVHKFSYAFIKISVLAIQIACLVMGLYPWTRGHFTQFLELNSYDFAWIWINLRFAFAAQGSSLLQGSSASRPNHLAQWCNFKRHKSSDQSFVVIIRAEGCTH